MEISSSLKPAPKHQLLRLAAGIGLIFSLYQVADRFFHHLHLDHENWVGYVLVSGYLVWAICTDRQQLNHQPFSTLHVWLTGIGATIFVAALLLAAISLGLGQKFFGIVQQLHFEQQLSVWPFVLMATLVVVLPTILLIFKHPKLHSANMQTSFFLCLFYTQLHPLDLMWIYSITERYGQPISLTMTLVNTDQTSQTWAIQPRTAFTPQHPTLRLCYSCFDHPTPALQLGKTYTVAAKIGWFGDVAIDHQSLNKLTVAQPVHPST